MFISYTASYVPFFVCPLPFVLFLGTTKRSLALTFASSLQGFLYIDETPPWASLSAQWTGPALSAYPRRRDINILERAQWERNFVDFLFFFKSYVDMVLVTLLEQKGWNRWAPEFSLNLSHSVIVLPKILGLVIFIFRGNKIGNIQQITPNCRAWFRGLGSSPVCHWVCCSCTAYPIVSVCLFQLQGSCLGLETGGRELLCWTCCSSLFSTPLWC